LNTKYIKYFIILSFLYPTSNLYSVSEFNKTNQSSFKYGSKSQQENNAFITRLQEEISKQNNIIQNQQDTINSQQKTFEQLQDETSTYFSYVATGIISGVASFTSFLIGLMIAQSYSQKK